MRFYIILDFDERVFDSEKLTKEYVERVAKDRLGGEGVKIRVLTEREVIGYKGEQLTLGVFDSAQKRL